MKIFEYDEILSTNKAARQMLAQNVVAPFCLIANKQTAGIGRYDRTFYSPEGGLYMTLVLNEKHFGDIKFITGRIAVILIETIQKFTSHKPQIKWVNDILIDGKKAAGILVEKTGGNLIIGIGVNLYKTEEEPAHLKDKMTYLNLPKEKKGKFFDFIIDLIMNQKISSQKNIELYTKYSKTPVNEDGSLKT